MCKFSVIVSVRAVCKFYLQAIIYLFLDGFTVFIIVH